MIKYITYILVLCLLSSCSFFQSRSDDTLLARVGDSHLYESEISSLQSNEFSSTDSLMFKQQYINSWAKQELLLQKAVLNINQEELEIEKRLEAYRRSLMIHAYEQKLIQQSMDTLVLQEHLQNYYAQHTEDYLLSEKILKVMFLKASQMAPKLDSISDWFFDKDTLRIDLIEAYSHQYAKRFYNNPKEWLTWEDFEEIFPSELDISRLSVKKNTMLLKDSLDVYLVRLHNLKDQGEIAPLEYVVDEIKSILLNQRKLKTLEVIQSKLLEDAKRSKQFEIY